MAEQSIAKPEQVASELDASIKQAYAGRNGGNVDAAAYSVRLAEHEATAAGLVNEEDERRLLLAGGPQVTPSAVKVAIG